MKKPNIPEIIKERMPLWEKRLLEKNALPLLLIGVNDNGVITLAPEGVGPADMLKILEHASELLKEYFEVIPQEEEDGLTKEDKDRLIASIDFRHREDYDVEIIEQLNSLPVPSPEQLQDRTRRTLVHFIEETYKEDIIALEDAGEGAEDLFKGIMIGLLIDGYNLALLRGKPL